MGEDNDQKGLTEAEGEAAPERREPPPQNLPKEAQSPTGVPWTKPGHIAEPKEKDWEAEPADPYRGVDKKDPFEGRPRTKVPQGSDTVLEQSIPGPGQPLPDRKK